MLIRANTIWLYWKMGGRKIHFCKVVGNEKEMKGIFLLFKVYMMDNTEKNKN